MREEKTLKRLCDQWPCQIWGQARLGLSKSQRSEKLGSTERDVTVPGTELLFFFLVLFSWLGNNRSSL